MFQTVLNQLGTVFKFISLFLYIIYYKINYIYTYEQKRRNIKKDV